VQLVLPVGQAVLVVLVVLVALVALVELVAQGL
jgi:hypothetical protein